MTASGRKRNMNKGKKEIIITHYTNAERYTVTLTNACRKRKTRTDKRRTIQSHSNKYIHGDKNKYINAERYTATLKNTHRQSQDDTEPFSEIHTQKQKRIQKRREIHNHSHKTHSRIQ